ncbi:aldehyde dehydrogenase family protein [Pseudomonas sp. TH41]|uniref:aldehyde dehydrogenase family protein n=1 Tax=Pseudomonas sp. TH41 TaxID=2796405 RepID=UPI001914BE2B|nr:aldehyde dehydrogenase family protein [Pseudomonas sp. TH41]MBK5354684.1 aldehyde dehydrogenase family protein [Pseudomonas sp. TH41]
MHSSLYDLPLNDDAQAEALSASGRVAAVLALQQAASLSEGPPSAELRIERINRVINLLLNNQQRLCEALSRDFTWRSHDQSLLADVLLPVQGLKYARDHVRRWMRPERRRAELGSGWLGARAAIHFQPLGTIGIISPWNFPIAIALGPLAEALAAGNRAIILFSDQSPETAGLLIKLLAEQFEETEVAAFIGGADLGAAFSALPLDHLVFTGSPRVGRLVMRAAAQHLTPLTLELGGKSPTIIGRGADLENAARRIWGGKGVSAGQACIAPDYVLVHEDDRERLLSCMQVELRRMFPTLLNNPDYTAMATPGQYQRMQACVRDAREQGVRVIEVNPANEDLSASRKIAPTLLVDPPDTTLAMQEEVFGPLLPIRGYRHINEALDYINAHARPLALYYFGDDRCEAKHVLERTHSGGACINEVMQHLFQTDLPFGGCGHSGFGRYRGGYGFKAFSLERSVFMPPRWDVMGVLRPPYGRLFRRVIGALLKP